MNLEQKLGVSLELRQAQLIKLEQRLSQKTGKFEKQLLKKIELIDIDLDESPYHVDMLGVLVVRESEEKKSLIGSIVEKSELSDKPIQKIIVERFSMEDISLDIGTKRNVDVITIVFEDGKELTLTVSLDKEAVDSIEKSPSYQEAQTLRQKGAGDTWAVQKYYGMEKVEDKEGLRVAICKEFLDGPMLANATTAIDPYMSEEEQARAKRLAYATGRMVANTLTQLGGVPKDSNPLNIIIIREDTADEHTRYCDVEGIVTDEEGIRSELDRLKNEFKEYGGELFRGINEHYDGALFKKPE
ncbi:MAG: hypothetical protein A3B31_00845 [Candidatus Komeilibacteria bacterium RIFCSPLOWO2_01_FULL_53_11]|uniref:Uncharacterized protein n=1 Tax=Candidatus Komeilibacteria bacterium RIFCSPLOWO2_01_FULL_53_11 TaxID=1798552 RepID=A0A1G2BQB1_9BACT|nr:MAG: hypothetical protein A3B31_00845 [Candidatus Komeilibacteria bacterium RIFCSPLOWO2_01_FULL_53_11]